MTENPDEVCAAMAASSDDWGTVMRIAMTQGGLDVDDLRNGLGISRFALGRWRDGLDGPHPLARDGALRSLQALVRVKASSGSSPG